MNKSEKNGASAPKKKDSGTTTPSPTTPERPAEQPVKATWYPFLQVRIGLVVGLVSVLAYYGMQSEDPQTLPSVYAVCSPEGQESVYTVNGLNDKAECLLVNGSHIALVGNSIHAAHGENLPIRYLPEGAILVPGISDSHCHTLEYGGSQRIPLTDTTSARDVVTRVKKYIQSTPDISSDRSALVEGWGWDHESWKGNEMPTWEQFEGDPVVANRRIILQSRDGHAIWVSKRILDENGPFPDTVDGGLVLRDGFGQPTGVFIDSAQFLIKKPHPTHEQLEALFKTTADHALAAGLTSLHDAGFDPQSLAFFRRYIEEKPLPIRIYGMTFFNETGSYWGDKARPFADPERRLTTRSVKIFADGALRTGGAALYEPYADNPSTSGLMRISPEVLDHFIPRFLKDGWQVNVHAIGDRANGLVLDAFEKALNTVKVDVASLRPRLEHAQILTKEDMKRVGDLGVIASIQPTHVISDMSFGEDRLGPERVKGLYAFRGLLDSGARITLGSDFPVEDINPLKGFYAAITRLSIDGTSPHGPGGWFPEQRLSRLEALRGMTIDPAYASFTEDVLGSLEKGKIADYVVLSRDIMTVPVTEIMGTAVLATVIDGRVVFGDL